MTTTKRALEQGLASENRAVGEQGRSVWGDSDLNMLKVAPSKLRRGNFRRASKMPVALVSMHTITCAAVTPSVHYGEKKRWLGADVSAFLDRGES